MCNQILKSGLQCKIKSKTKLCHIHMKASAISDYAVQKDLLTKKQNEIINLNKSLEKKSDIIKELYKEISIYKIKLFSLQEDNNNMKEDYNNYQIIKEYEKQKNDLILKGINIYNYNNTDFHNKRHLRNHLAHAV